MTSKIVVNNIESDSGINTVTIIGDVSVGSSITATDITATHHGSGADLTNLPAANLTGILPAISGANLTGVGASFGNSSVNTSGIITATAFVSDTPLSHRNLVINGAMLVAQRATSDVGSTGGYKTVDRFPHYATGLDENATQSQVDVASGTTPYTLGFRKAFRITNGNQTSGAGAGDMLFGYYNLEAQDVSNSGWNYTSASSFITLSFWVKSSVAQNFYGYVRTRDGTEQSRPFQTGSLTANTWTKITKVIPGDSNIQIDNDTLTGMGLYFAPFAGANYTDNSKTVDTWSAYSSSARTPDNTGTWYTTNDATFEYTGVQLEVGPVATPFEHRSFGEELSRCQRYCVVDIAEKYWYNGHGGNVRDYSYYSWPTTMRAAPTITFGTPITETLLNTSGGAGHQARKVTATSWQYGPRASQTGNAYGEIPYTADAEL